MATTSTSDPVCGMRVDPNSSVTVEHDGHLYYFCEAACADTFRDDPDRWIPRDLAGEA